MNHVTKETLERLSLNELDEVINYAKILRDEAARLQKKNAYDKLVEAWEQYRELAPFESKWVDYEDDDGVMEVDLFELMEENLK